MKLIVMIFGMLLAMSTCVWAQTRIAFVAGIERYTKSGLDDLQYAEDDAREVKKTLDQLGFKTTSVIGEDASLKKLDKELDEFISVTKQLNKTDIVVVYFSGHGVQKLVQQQTADGRTIEVEEPFFCPNDAIKRDVSTLLSLNTILKRLEDLSGSDHNIILLDACRDSADKSGKGGIDGSTIRELSDKLALFFAAKSGRRSYESRQVQHGIFTHYLLEGLRGKAADEDNEITFQGLTDYVSKRVQRDSPGLLDVKESEAQKPNLMGNLSGTIVLGRLSKDKPAIEQAKTFTNSLGMKLVRIEAGEFLMGNDDSNDVLLKLFEYSKKDWYERESPCHLVTITHPFYMAAHEVTVGQFRRFVQATGYRTEAETNGIGGSGDTLERVENSSTYELRYSPTINWKKPGFSQGEDHPVANVSWNDAEEFCKWLTREEGEKYRLPTEAEWEYSCRAGTRTRYWNGDSPDGLTKAGNLSAGNDGFSKIAPVGSFAANPWGIYDMHGNVSEWCWDWYGEYSDTSLIDPKGPSTGDERVIRGGSYNDLGFYGRCAFRFGSSPNNPSVMVGFRVVLEVPNK